MKQLIFLILCVFGAPSVMAEDNDSDGEWSPVTAFLVFEGMVLANAGLATADPEVYGTALAILSPLAVTSNSSNVTNWVGVSSALTLGVYNAVELSDERYSKKDVFVSNIYGWHALAAITYVTELLTGQDIETDNIALSLSDEGFSVAFNYQF